LKGTQTPTGDRNGEKKPWGKKKTYGGTSPLAKQMNILEL